MSSPGGLQPAGAPRESGIHAGFDSGGDVWKIVLEKGVTRISFAPIRDHWGDGHADNVKQAALAYMEDRSPDTVLGGVQALARMARDVPVGDIISAAALMDYRSLLAREQLHYLGHVAAFLKFWVARGYAGVDRDVLQFFSSIKIPGNVKGAAVRTHHPTKGPFTDVELQSITLAAREAHGEGRVSRQDFAILLMLIATGSRPGQVSMLACGDLVPPIRGSAASRLLVPSLKKRTRKRLTRERVIPGELAVLLKELVEERSRDERFRGIPVDRRPIFAVEAPAFASLAEAHIGSYGVRCALDRIQSALGLRSARTAAPINLAPRRFRSTLGTRAADVGHPPVLIAHLLDHSDLQHVGVYVESRGSIQDRMDAALHGRAEPLAGLFRGTIVAGEVEAGAGEAPSRRVASAAGGGVGTCAGPRGCVRLAPLACYTCAAFRPWRDAPHEDLLRSLVEERRTLLADGISPQVAAANDATIMAVAEVADRCRAMRTAAAHG